MRSKLVKQNLLHFLNPRQGSPSARKHVFKGTVTAMQHQLSLEQSQRFVLPMHLSKIFDTCALPDMTFEAETRAFAENVHAQPEAGWDAEQEGGQGLRSEHIENVTRWWGGQSCTGQGPLGKNVTSGKRGRGCTGSCGFF